MMDPDIKDALASIQASVNRGFDEVNRRIDNLVTRGEFQATVERIDAQHASLRQDYDHHESSTPEVVKTVEAKIDAAKSILRREVSGVKDAAEKRLGEFAITARWAIGVALTALGLLIAAGVLQLIPGK